MQFILIYATAGGTTKSTTELLKEVIKKNHHQVECINIGISPYRENYELVIEKISKADLVGFGSPTYHLDMFEPMLRLFETMEDKGENEVFSFKAFLYLNYGGITSGKALWINARRLDKMGIGVIGALKIAAPHFHKHHNFPQENIAQWVEAFYDQMNQKKFAPISFKNMKSLFKPEKKRVNILYPLAHVIGEKRNLSIDWKASQCKKCRKCLRECPMSAIELEDSLKINYEKCIHCYHCVAACKTEALRIDVKKLDQMICINKKIMGQEKCLNQIYC